MGASPASWELAISAADELFPSQLQLLAPGAVNPFITKFHAFHGIAGVKWCKWVMGAQLMVADPGPALLLGRNFPTLACRSVALEV